MFDQILQAQQKAEEIKTRLKAITVTSEVENGAIKVTATADKAIKNIEINASFLKEADKEQLEELLTSALNKALEQAENVSQSEMAAATKDMFGGLQGMFGK